MATTLNTIYPPQVETFMPSFCYNDSAEVWFNISSYSEDMIDNIKFIHISMVDQRNNTNVFAGKDNNQKIVYPQYYPIVFNKNSMYDITKKMYKLTIPPQVLKTTPTYNNTQYYKVQLRFDLTGSVGFTGATGYTNPTTFFSWDGSSNYANANALQLAVYTTNNKENFSEWSTGTLLKPIFIPTLSLKTFNISQRININPSTDILIVGNLKFNDINSADKTKDETEYLSWYQIKILDDNKINILFDSNKIYATTKNQINYRLNTSNLSIGTNYQMRFIYETNNGYSEIIDYPIKIVAYSNATDITYSKSIDEENGIITLTIDTSNYNTGYLVVRRASHRSNFTNWELISAKDISSSNSLTIIDNTIESMTGYRYQLQYMTNLDVYAPIYIENNDIIHCDFYGGLFSDKEKVLRIMFNFQVSNRANAANRSKVDTLGGQYPLFTQNAKLKYHTYSISGRISTEDNGELFLSKQDILGNEYYNYRYTYTSQNNDDPHTTECKTIKPNQDWLYEREYRDAVEDWLNNGKPKLFRSMTEGNIIVMLDGISMTPDVTLGRRLYDFSATMYEIGDGKSLESLSSLGLFNVEDER